MDVKILMIGSSIKTYPFSISFFFRRSLIRSCLSCCFIFGSSCATAAADDNASGDGDDDGIFIAFLFLLPQVSSSEDGTVATFLFC